MFLSISFEAQKTQQCFGPFSDSPGLPTRPVGRLKTNCTTSLHSDPPKDRLAFLQSHAFAPSTHHAYCAGIRWYITFVNSRHWDPLPGLGYTHGTLPPGSFIMSASQPFNYIWLASGFPTSKRAFAAHLQIPTSFIYFCRATSAKLVFHAAVDYPSRCLSCAN